MSLLSSQTGDHGNLRLEEKSDTQYSDAVTRIYPIRFYPLIINQLGQDQALLQP